MATFDMNITILFLSLFAILPIFANNEENQVDVNQFSLDLYQKTSKLNPDKSIVVSPLSAEVILGLLSTAAKGNTKSEILDAIHINDVDQVKSKFKSLMTRLKNIDENTLNMVNKIYVKDGEAFELSPDFKSVAKETFFAGVENIDFSKNKRAARTINDWVKKETKNKVEDLLPSTSLDDRTRAVLVNAIYFQGKWELPFDKNKNTKGQFHVNDLETVEVDMMNQDSEFLFAYSTILNAKIVSLPYTSPDTSLVILLPFRKNGFSEMESKMNATHLQQILDRLLVFKSHVNITMPKFNVKTSLDLKVILRKLGIEKLFDENAAEINGILKSKQELYISEAVHKAFIDVNEEGTEAAGASAYVSNLRSGPVDFVADHPFIYLLINKGNIIFCGKYVGK